MYGGRNDEDGSFADVDCYDVGEGVCMWEGSVCVGGMCVCGRDVYVWEGCVYVGGMCVCGRDVRGSGEYELLLV